MLKARDTQIMRKTGNRKGFTILEMAVVLAIMGIIIATLYPLYTLLMKKQKIAETRNEELKIKEAVITYYRQNFTLPSPVSDGSFQYAVPASTLGLSPSVKYDPIKGTRYLYFVTNSGSPVSEIRVDGNSIGNTAAVIVSPGFNGAFDGENATPADGRFNEYGSGGFDDILVYISESELQSETSWRRKIDEDIAILNQAAQILAANDDDVDGRVDEDPSTSPCGPMDPPGDCNGMEDWSLMNSQGLNAITRAGLVNGAEHLVDPWGTPYIWNSSTHRFYSAGPNRHDDSCGGDDICP